MRNLHRFLLLFAAPLLLAAQNYPPTPSELYGDLFVVVQSERVFDDSKTFADAEPKGDPEAIMAAWRLEQPQDREAVRAFVLEHFDVPGEIASRRPLRQHIAELWPQLVRTPQDPVPGSSKIGLPEPYIVPGGRFREIYYWDSYFTMLGLQVDGQDALIEGMIDDFVSLIERFGHIPNGTRTYYLSRSQPPFFALMLDLSQNTNPSVKRRRLAGLRKEYDFWMRGKACASAGKPCERVVVMPDGAVLNRYWDGRDIPREESFAEDVATAAKAASRPVAETYRDLRAAAESGWDFSSRWLADPQDLATIRTSQIVPVDLNALLYAVERRIAKGCSEGGNLDCVNTFSEAADRRRAAMDRYLWDAAGRHYADYDLDQSAPTPILSAATLYPLFVGSASDEQALAVAETVRERLLAHGGLRTTVTQTGEQWDAPNGWAPLHWIAVDGLARYGHETLAKDIAKRWIATVERAYCDTGKMLEKYDVEKQQPGGGGEYPLQDGFGWTNGVTAKLLSRWPELQRSCAAYDDVDAG